MKHITRVFTAFILLYLSINLSDLSAQVNCVSASSIDIIALESKSISFSVEGVLTDDLSAVTQGLKSVRMNFTHDNIADIEVVLTSPAGQSVQLIGPLGSGFSVTDNIIWDVSFIPCDSIAEPDPDIVSEQFLNDSPWAIFNRYSGSYYPFSGCFEDIDLGPVNGIWTLTINDGGRFDSGFIDLVEIKFLEQEGLVFSVCEANAGNYTNSLEMTVCDFQDDLLLTDIAIDNFKRPDDQYNYDFIIADFLTGDILDIQPFPDLRGFPIADYTICALSYQKSDSTDIFDQLTSQSLNDFRDFVNQTPAPVCADIMENCTNIIVLPILDTLKIDTSICENGTFILTDATGFVQEYSREGTFIRKIGQNLCDSLVVVTITKLEIEAVISSDTDTIINCPTDTITLGSSRSVVDAPPNRLWSTGDGEIIGDPTAAQIKVSSPGTYFLQIDNNKGCVDETMVVIGERLDMPSVDILVNDTITCLNPSTMISISSAEDIFNVRWRGPDFNGEGAMITVSDGGIYIVEGDFDNGCSFIDSVQVIENFGIPEFEVATELVGCRAQIYFIDSNIIPEDAKWISPSGVELDELTPIISEQGVYDLVATSGNGCIDTIPVTIEFEPPIEDLILTGDTLNCLLNMATISIAGDTEFSSILWEGPGVLSSDDSILVDSTGIFTARTIDLDNCPGIGQFELVKDSIPPEVIIQGRQLGCVESELTLTASSSEDLSQAIWEGPSGTTRGDEFEIDEVGSYVIELIGNNGCIGRDTFFVNREEPFDVNISEAIFDCDLQPISIDASISISPERIEWTGPNDFLENQEDILAVDTGMYILAVTSPDQCIVIDTITLGVREANITITEVDDVTIDCSTDSLQLSPEVSGDYATAVWVNDDFDVFTRIDPVIQKPGRYQLEVMDDFGCVADTFLIVGIDTLKPEVNINQMGVLACESTEVLLTAEFDRVTTPILLWLGDSGPLSPQDAIDQRITEGGSFILRVFNVDNSCVGEDRVTIAENENTFIDAELTIVPACDNMENGAIVINELVGGEGPAEISLDNIVFEESQSLENLSVGDDTLYIKDANGCVIDKAYTIPQGEQVMIDLGEDIEEFNGELVELGIDTTGLSGSVIEWFRDETSFEIGADSIQFIGESDESIRVEVTSQNGCVSADEINILIEDRVTNIYAPNSLLIGDADNGVFRLQSNDLSVRVEQLTIYDRWGNLMFTARNLGVDQEFGWDGTVNGQAVEVGVYGYRSLVRLQSGELRRLMGSFTVFR